MSDIHKLEVRLSIHHEQIWVANDKNHFHPISVSCYLISVPTSSSSKSMMPDGNKLRQVHMGLRQYEVKCTPYVGNQPGSSMMTSSNGNIFCVTGPLWRISAVHRWVPPSQRPVTRSFDVFYDLRLNKRLRKQARRWWFETSLRSLWRHCNG